MSAVIEPVLEFLHAPTPAGWQQAALEHLPELLIDHANCEKKGGQQCDQSDYRYVEYPHLLQKMSRVLRVRNCATLNKWWM